MTLPGFLQWLAVYGWRIVVVLLLAAGFYLLLKRTLPPLLRRFVCASMSGRQQAEIEQRVSTLTNIAVKTGLALLIIMTIFTILSQVGVNITTALAGLGIAGLAIGFGGQNLVRDVISGLFILMEDQYNVGDVVKIADVIGGVTEVNLRRTVLRDLDGVLHSVPNGEVKVSSNYTKELARANIAVGIAYKEDVDQVMGIMRGIWAEMHQDPAWREFILRDEPMVLRVDDFAESAVIIRIVGETTPFQRWDVMGEYRRRLKRAFDAQNIEIPWNHTKVFFGGPLEHHAVPPSGPPSG